MAYTVSYTEAGKMERNNVVSSKSNHKILVSLCLVLLLVFGTVKLLSSQRIQQFLIPGDPKITAAAFSEMTQSVRDGQPVDDAIVAFCRQIIAEAGALCAG